jgi:hypothetical protein
MTEPVYNSDAAALMMPRQPPENAKPFPLVSLIQLGSEYEIRRGIYRLRRTVGGTLRVRRRGSRSLSLALASFSISILTGRSPLLRSTLGATVLYPL